MEHELDEAGRRLLTFLVGKLPGAAPNDPRTFVGYKAVHDEMGLPRLAHVGRNERSALRPTWAVMAHYAFG